VTAHLTIGTLLIAAFALFLAWESPAPGPLSAVHAGVWDGALERLDGCAVCHSEDGLKSGCLACHEEISDSSLHAGFAEDACERCHPEHLGDEFEPRDTIAWIKAGLDRHEFTHEHVPAFDLTDGHAELGCEECHGKKTLLGLTQVCTSCHEAVHGKAFEDCTACHTQAAFKPALNFDHAPFFRLEHGHAEVSCERCHPRFGTTRGKTCAQCHETPHRPEWTACEECHDTASFRNARPTLEGDGHAVTGFALMKPHERLACERCHGAGIEFRPQSETDCAACHDDPHQGQFKERCIACHEGSRFKPTTFTIADHESFELGGAHARVGCGDCHKEGRFVGTPRDCRSCHDDVHAGQFGRAGCETCHTTERFLPARYDVAQHHAFALTGAHRAVSCRACHTEHDGVRRFRGTAQACKQCHADPHDRQFARELKRGDCTTCHRADAATFAIRPYAHTWPLRGAHESAKCAQCHTRGAYRGTAQSCASCHTDVHRGQFGRNARCEKCHGATAASWDVPAFNHDRDTRFRLDAQHRRVDCALCHPGVPQKDGTNVVQYRPLGRTCGDCHDFESR